MVRVRWLSFAISCLLFALPFGWFQPGEMDLGGDSSRLYFYDPIAYLHNYSMSAISPSGVGAENMGYFTIPLVAMLAVVKRVVGDTTVMIAAFHGMSLAVAFFAVCRIVEEVTGDEPSVSDEARVSASVLAGLLYVFSPVSVGGWDKALMTHNYVFLNPLMVYLLLRYVRTQRPAYLVWALLTSVVFSANFSAAGAPVFFSFYPLTVLFLVAYSSLVLRRALIWRHVLWATLAFVGLHSFHFIAQIVSLFSVGSATYASVFSPEGKFVRGLSYFQAIAPTVKASLNILILPQMSEIRPAQLLFAAVPLTVILALMRSATCVGARTKRTLQLSALYFLVAFFFATANVTQSGRAAYETLFRIPGFSMFRNFYGQWVGVYIFAYALLFGQSLAILIRKRRAPFLAVGVMGALLISSALPFISGALVNKVLWQSKGVRIHAKADPRYEEALEHIKQAGLDGKVLTLPLSDPGYQIVAGFEGGAYQGPSTIAYRAGIQDFAGIEELGRLKDTVLASARRRDFPALTRALGFLNIQHVFYNADPRVYDDFPTFPYEHVRRFFPQDQEGYQQFIRAWNLPEQYRGDGRFFLYRIPQQYYYPRVFVADSMVKVPAGFMDWDAALTAAGTGRHAFVEGDVPKDVPHAELVSLEPARSFSQVAKNPDPPRILVRPFARISPRSMLYPLVVLKEKLILQGQGDYNYRGLIATRLLFAAKRVAELERYGEEMTVGENVPDGRKIDTAFPAPKRLGVTPVTLPSLPYAAGSWEAALARYADYVRDNVAAVDQSQESTMWKEAQRFLFQEYLHSHRALLLNAVRAGGREKREKAYLTRLIDEVFDWLDEAVNVTLPDPSVITYPTAEKLEPGAFYTILADGRETAQRYVSVGAVPFPTTGSIRWEKRDPITVHYRPSNLLAVSQPVEMRSVLTGSDSASLAIDATTVPIGEGVNWEVRRWEGQSLYFLSFRYRTGDEPFHLRVYEYEVPDPRGGDSHMIMDQQLRSLAWKQYRAVVRSGPFANAAVVRVLPERNARGKVGIEMRDISLIKIAQEPLLLVRGGWPSGEKEVPQIEVKKRAPTAYDVSVKGAHGPYVLVLNQEYHSRWSLLLNGREIARRRHWRANAHANAWYVTPDDTAGTSDYTLTIAFGTQRYFLIGTGMSLFTLICVVAYAAASLMQRRYA